ncbi:type III secretion system chaperone family protein [Acidithiobacillus caldus]|jgi:hypothetical protein|uniref:Uncharacterized protein n=2 Tax=Acidithiobacillus caldus TaxID=33059 RepID=A0A059ZYJ9_ACICK|nr:hypothetical protein [Acidithiobacillus caldus]AIA56533.1 hypothetical protein Acaty_c2695 [Acidithiobacillus caldus ATCC 51756]MBU2729361.1 YbjN domain-containing protein [Acidithiobacillus caldus]MBU2735585.1 YbjN domain-containing protein [Acidithiobacillus caldus ATCC 51756]MBU2744998.1 YbjN domain-containing protein [Acidithiobacillus caldus]MBU2762793.1 YbjN domain-containing protein [Acidithiobacillus caldus]
MDPMKAVAALFADLNWPARKIPEYPVYSCALAVPNGPLEIFCHVHAERERVLFYVRPQELDIVHARLAMLMEFLTRANYGLPLGNFELDLADHELNFKNSVQLPERCVAPDILKPYLLQAVETCNFYLPGIREVLAGAVPAEVIGRLEQGAASTRSE